MGDAELTQEQQDEMHWAEEELKQDLMTLDVHTLVWLSEKYLPVLIGSILQRERLLARGSDRLAARASAAVLHNFRMALHGFLEVISGTKQDQGTREPSDLAYRGGEGGGSPLILDSDGLPISGLTRQPDGRWVDNPQSETSTTATQAENNQEDIAQDARQKEEL